MLIAPLGPLRYRNVGESEYMYVHVAHGDVPISPPSEKTIGSCVLLHVATTY